MKKTVVGSPGTTIPSPREVRAIATGSFAVLDESLRELAREPQPDRRAAIASRVKARCAEAGVRICREAIQIHGAIGFTDEFDIGLYLKRALVLAAWLGNATQHRRRYASLALRAE